MLSVHFGIRIARLRCLEEDIVKRVASVAFVLDSFEEVVIYIFRFPIGEREVRIRRVSHHQ